MRIMVTGGGTGGHTSPAVAVIEELQKRDPRLAVQWVGRKGAIEERVSKALGVPFRSVSVEGWPRGKSLKKLWVAAKLAVAAGYAFLLLKRFRPQVVFAVGGYVSLPLAWAAQRLGIPTVLHEQNKRLGLANRLLAQRAARILLSYPDTIGEYPRERARVVGNPVRAGFVRALSRTEARAKLGLDPAIPVVLVSGGSQGARTLNTAMAEMIPQFHSEEAQVLWMTGTTAVAAARLVAEKAPVFAQVFAYIDDMPTACAAADLIVSRAGASTTAELAVLGKPSILVPYPHATDNHQEQNARAFEQAGAAVVMLDHECGGANLLKCVRGLLGDSDRLAAMGSAAASLAKPGATESIAEEILSLVFDTVRQED